jgi:hypothetical protein
MENGRDSLEFGIARELRRIKAQGYRAVNRKMGPLDGPMAHPARLTASRDNLVERLPARFRSKVEASNKRLKERQKSTLKHEHDRGPAKRRERSKRRVKRAPRRVALQLESLEELFEFAVMPKDQAGLLRLMNRIRDRVKALGYGPKHERRRDELMNWAQDVSNRRDKLLGVKHEPTGYLGGKVMDGNSNRKLHKSRKKEYEYKRDLEKLNRATNKADPRGKDPKKVAKIQASRKKLLKKLGWE